MPRNALQTQLPELPHPLEDEDLDVQVEYWCKLGSIKSRDLIIKHNMRLAVSLVADIVHRAWHKKDDLTSVSLVALVDAVNRFPLIAKDNCIVPYIASTIRSRLRSELQNDQTVRIPERTFHRKWDELNLNIQTPIPLEANNLSQKQWEKLIVLEKIHPVEWRELMELSARTQQELTILELAVRGYCDREIGEQIEMSTSYVHRVRHLVFGRFKYYWSL